MDRWTILGISMFSYSALGIGDTFGIYSPVVKSAFNLTQDELTTIGMAGFIPNLAGAALIPGLVNDMYGGAVVMAGAGVLVMFGLLGFWATVKAAPDGDSGWAIWPCGAALQLAIFEAVRSFGNQWPSAGVIPTHMKAFAGQPLTQVKMVAALKCIGSIGGGLASLVYIAFIRPKGPSITAAETDASQLFYIEFAGITAGGLCLLGAPFLLVRTGGRQSDDLDSKRFDKTFVLLFIVIPLLAGVAYVDQAGAAASSNSNVTSTTSAPAMGSSSVQSKLVTVTIVERIEARHSSSSGSSVSPLGVHLSSDTGKALAIVILFLWAATALSPAYRVTGSTLTNGIEEAVYSTKVNSRLSELVSLTADHDDDSQNCDRIGKSTSSSDSKDDDDAVYSNDIAGTEMNVWQTVKTLELWLIMWGSCCTLGSYSIIQFNVAQIAESYGHPNANAFCVLLTLVFAALGRLVAAYLHHRGNRELWPRGTQFVVLNATMLVAMLCLSAGGLAGLVVGVGIGGFVYGAYWTVVPLVFADMFGLKHLGANYKLATIAEAVGYLLIGRTLASSVYDSHIEDKSKEFSFKRPMSTASLVCLRAAPLLSLYVSIELFARLAGSNTCSGTACFRETVIIAAGLCATALFASGILFRRTRRT